MIKSVILILLLSLAGCAYPKTSVSTIDTRPKLAFKNVPINSTLYIDGLVMGNPAKFDGKINVLIIEPGTHEISIMSENGSEIYRQTIFVESELKTINVGH